MMKLHIISREGTTGIVLNRMSGVLTEVLNATKGFYQRTGFHPPWVSYLAVSDGEAVGCCSFKAVPRGGRVEIAYFTFPFYEGRGFATQMARELVSIARECDKMLMITARTLPEENASTTILKKTGFINSGPVQDPEDGTVWEWTSSGGRETS